MVGRGRKPKDYNGAAQSFAGVLEIEPDNAEAKRQLALAYARQKRWDNWKPLDFVLIFLPSMVAWLLWPPFRKRWPHVTIVSAMTKMAYGPEPTEAPDMQTLAHEAYHLHQVTRDGFIRHHWRMLFTHWRIFNEAQAYAYAGTRLDKADDAIMAGAYYVTRPRSHDFGIATMAYASLGLLPANQEEA